MCLDERPVQLHSDVRNRLPASPNKPSRIDSEYRRHGTANVYAIVAPHEGVHLTHATPNRKALNYVKALQRIARRFPKAKRIHLVQDNLNIHCEKSCIQVLGEKRGKKLWGKFIKHFTPKHGSWLNIAETEISLWSRECLGSRRIPEFKQLAAETMSWNAIANQQRRTIQWKFTVAKARHRFNLQVENPLSED